MVNRSRLGAGAICRRKSSVTAARGQCKRQQCNVSDGTHIPWRVIHLRAEATFDEGWRSADCQCGKVEGPHGEPLWPSKWSCQELALKKADPTAWATHYQGEPSAGIGKYFVEYPVNYYKEVRAEEFNVYLLCDPAMGKTRRADFTAMWAVGLGSDQNVYWLEMVRARLSLIERMDALFRMVRRWHPIAVGYEEYGLMTDVAAIKDRQERENYRFNITALGRSGSWHQVSKPDRIKTLVPLAAAGRIWLPDPATVGRDSVEVATVKQFVEEEWTKYPLVKWDDMLDVMSRINDPDFGAVFPEPASDVDLLPQGHLMPGTSWMSG